MNIKIKAGLLLVTLVLSPSLHASDLIRIGSGAASGGMGNVAGLAHDPLSALSANPAFLSGQDSGYQFGLTALYADSEFRSSLGERSSADGGPGIVPDFAVVRAADGSWTFAAGLLTQSAMRARFDFTDPPGTLGVSYGRQRHESEYLVISAAAAAAYQINERLAVGAGLTVAYNRNRLRAPYIFQSHPALQGLKVLVDLEADDIALSTMLGLDYQLSETLSFSLAWSMASEFRASGDLGGDLSGLGLGIAPEFHYRAAVETALPAFASAGLRWDYSQRLALGLQLDWINWESTFAELPIRLTEGNNAELNAFLGSNRIDDVAPLDWQDQYTLHLGAEYLLAGSALLRLGYEYNNVPVPRTTMTPMTGAILRHALSIGTRQDFGRTQADYYYRFSFAGSRRHTGQSSLAGNEYSGSSLDLNLHTVGVSYSF